MWLTAEFLNNQSVATAVSALTADGVPSSRIELFSDRPVELPPGVLDRPTQIPLYGVLGALLVGGSMTVFVHFTEYNYKLVTGGMPLFSGWSIGVISYETTMAGAVLGVVLRFLLEGSLLRGKRGAAPPELKPGSVFVRIECDEGSAQAALRQCKQAGAVDVVQEGGAA